ncbi:MAG: A/G-specific adenine glycosylase [Bacteroidia bacterium]|nr:MAG: A/G-specific adenine glycosylase [Bacteroidia bacterium]
MSIPYLLLKWYSVNKRSLPWRESQNPYHIWISEIILQQTRMDQGMAYYHRFVDSFPDVFSLAAAPEEKVLRLWQGLGYYSRARNLHQAANQIIINHNGKLPDNYKDWKNIKGVGPYTAAAIASICFNEPIPALDGNVMRILTRLFAVDKPLNKTATKKMLYDLAMDIIPRDKPGDFNQAMMDFGSMVCKPVNPLCMSCVLNHACHAYQSDNVHKYPRKEPKKPIRERYFHYFFFFCLARDNEIRFFVQKRTGNDIWKNMYELPLLETGEPINSENLLSHPWWKTCRIDIANLLLSQHVVQMQHMLTHQRIFASFYRIRVDEITKNLLEQRYLYVNIHEFDMLAKPVLLERYIKQVTS